MSDDANPSQSIPASESDDGSASAATAHYGDHFLLRRKFLKIFGQSFHVYDTNGQVCFFAKLKAFKLKEDIRIYADTDQQNELLRIQARSVIDFGATYDIIDSAQDLKLGALRRKGLKSILRDSWLILDVNDEEIGTLTEGGGLIPALLRRLGGFGTLLMPQTFDAEVNGQPVASFRQRRNPLIAMLDLDFSMDSQQLLDRRMGIAAALLMGAIEGRQN